MAVCWFLIRGIAHSFYACAWYVNTVNAVSAKMGGRNEDINVKSKSRVFEPAVLRL